MPPRREIAPTLAEQILSGNINPLQSTSGLKKRPRRGRTYGVRSQLSLSVGRTRSA